MTLLIEKERENLFLLTVSGQLRKAEMDQAHGAAEQAIRRAGRIRILAILDRFQGWEPGQDWGDMRFLLAYDEHIEKIAAVGEECWREQVLMFLGAGIRAAEVKYFTSSEAVLARSWIES